MAADRVDNRTDEHAENPNAGLSPAPAVAPARLPAPRPERRMPRAPQHRPRWALVLCSLMLVFSARSFLSGLALFTVAPQVFALDLDGGLVLTPEETLRRELEVATLIAEQHHIRLVRVHAAAKVLLGLIMLYAVASVVSLDPGGRRASMIAGWLSMAFQVFDGGFALAVLRPGILASAPTILAAVSRVGAGGTLASLRLVTLLFPLCATAVGIGFASLIVVYFGGPRGRRLYGLMPAESHGR